MKNLLKLTAAFIFMANLSYAGTVDAISVIINNQPITLYEIYKYADKLHISTKESLDILIRQKLEDAQIKKLNINASDFEVENYIKKLATKNGISEFKFFEMLKSKGIDEDDYRKDVKKKIEQEKLYSKIFSEKKVKIDENALKSYYESNKNKFVVAKAFTTVAYDGPSKESLEKIRKNPMLTIAGIKAKQIQFQSGKMNSNLENLLNQTKPGEFTPVFKTGDSYSMFYIKEKSGVKTVPFSKAKNYIYSLLSSQKEKDAIEDYFKKIKSTADIKVLRRPN